MKPLLGLSMLAGVTVAAGCASTRPYAARGAGPLAEAPAVSRSADDLESESPPAEGGMQRASLTDSGSTPAKEPAPTEKMLVSGDVTAITDDVAGLAAAIRAEAVKVGGAVTSEEMSGDAQHRQAALTLRLPPATVTSFIDWLAERSTLDRRHLQATDVTRRYFDRELAIRNLEVTMGRLHDLAKRPNAELKDVIAVEHEMTRVRGELERLRGEQRLLGDQVARATLTISLQMKRGVHAEPQLKFELVPHLSLLHLVDAGARGADRVGGGVSVMFSRWFSLDFEMFPRENAAARSYLLTMTTATYSDFLGGGRRRFFNPYLGLRVGGASIDGNGGLAYGADVGVELVRFKLFLVEISGRALGIWYGEDSTPKTDVLLEGVLGVGVPF
jgi:hypothetical protein